MSERELQLVALSFLPKLGLVQARQLAENTDEDLSSLFKKEDWQQAMERAKREVEFANKKNIQIYCYGQPGYPQRLADCADAPVVLYGLGNMDLNTSHAVVSVVGTRRMTELGSINCNRLVEDCARQNPQMTIVSGLAYGSDICAHRAALKNNLPTIGVLAHGLDQIYPPVHRSTAIQMLEQGGLLTEYPSGSPIHKGNFLQRNRIIAGLSDATVVVESKARGGSLSTAAYANSYGRQVFAFPGRVQDSISEGCNGLIKTQRASLIEGAEDLFYEMGWPYEKEQTEAKQLALALELSPEEQRIVDYLKQSPDQQAQENMMVLELDLSFAEVSSILMQLELKRLILCGRGGMVRLVSN